RQPGAGEPGRRARELEIVRRGDRGLAGRAGEVAGDRRAPAEQLGLGLERRRLQLLERELAEDRVLRVRDAVAQGVAAEVAAVVAQVVLDHRAQAAVVADLLVGKDAGPQQRARRDELEDRGARGPDL